MLTMDKYIGNFPQQLIDATAFLKAEKLVHLNQKISTVFFCGMGGSGMSAAIIQDLISQTCEIPLLLNQQDSLPAACNKSSLVICTSYSGETAETLSVFKQALKKKCMLVCISSGGSLKKLSERHKVECLNIPGGMPPRTSIGYVFAAQLSILHSCGILKNQYIKQIIKTADFLKKNQMKIKKDAKNIAKKIVHTIPLIYTSAEIESVAKRWKQQFNENSKMHAFYHCLPEMNHNELVAFHEKQYPFSILFLRIKPGKKELEKRFALSKKIMQKKSKICIDLFAEENSLLEQMFYLIHLGDWISYELSELKNIDAVNIDVLENLKKNLKTSGN